MNCPVLELTEELIRRDSVTPNDAGCLDVLGARLERLGFELGRMDRQGVSNLWATFGNQGPMVCFAGHTDVVQPVISISGHPIRSFQQQRQMELFEGVVRLI